MLFVFRLFIIAYLFLNPWTVSAQCNSWIQQDFDSFEYTTVCPFILPGTTYQTTPQGAGFGPSHSGNLHIYLNFQNGYVGPAFDRTYNVCVGQTFRISFYHRDAWGGQNNTTFNIYDANNVLLSSDIVPWTGNAWNQYVSPAILATTATLRLEIVNNSASIGNNDMVVDDMALEMCGISEVREYSFCGNTTPIDLFSLFSSNMPTNGVWVGPSPLNNGNLGTFDPIVNVNGVYEYQLPNPGNCIQPVSQVTVSSMSDMDLGNDTTICTGSSITLTASPGFDSYLWSNNATTQSITVNQGGNYSVIGEFNSGNLITNGDFSNGNTDFSTDYLPGTGGTWGLLSNPSTYAISTSPSAVHNNFQACGDHTSGNGNMLIVNGSGTPNSNVWCQTINVTPNTDYSFSCWITNALFEPNVAILQFYVNGAPIGNTFTTSVNGCNWQQYSDSWNSGSLTTVDICIINQNTTGGGNDFAIDDIQFSQVCTSTDAITVSIETPIQTVTTQNPVCHNGTDGAIYIENALAIEYSIDGGASWHADSSFANLSPGNYTVCSRTALGCLKCQTVVIGNPPQMTISVSNDTLICENGTAILSANAIGGSSFAYHWDFTNDTLPIQQVLPLNNTSYTVFAENEFGCISPTETIDVTLHPPLTGSISGLQTICAGETATITANVSGGMGAPYTFNWDTGDSGVSNLNHSIQVSPTDSTNFTVTIEDGCETTPLVLTARVNVGQIPIPSFIVLNPDQCEPAVFELMNTTDSTQSMSCNWIVNNDQLFSNQNLIMSDTLYAGTYDVSMVVTSYEGCIGYLDSIGALEVSPIPTANFSYSPNPVLMFNPVVLMNNTSVDAVNYQWFFQDANILSSTEENPQITYPEGVVAEYEVTLVAYSFFGCTDTIVKIVSVNPEVVLYAPNTFTPDGDAFNQTWRVYMEGIDIYQFNLLVYNRWGEIVFESNDLEYGWDGTYNGQSVQAGTYVWTIEAKNLYNDSKHNWTGHLNLIK